MIGFRPRHTLTSVARELYQGLRDGHITLSSNEEESVESIEFDPAFTKTHKDPGTLETAEIDPKPQASRRLTDSVEVIAPDESGFKRFWDFVTEAPQTIGGTVHQTKVEWRINGYRASITVWTSAEWERLTDRPSDAQYYPCGVWCALRLEEGQKSGSLSSNGGLE